MITLRAARDTVLTKLGDTILTPASARVWSESEIEGYLKDAVRDFAYQTRIMWDMDYLDDLPYTGGYNFAFEKPFRPTAKIVGKQFDYTAEFERDYTSSQLPAATHTNVDERDDFLVKALVAAVAQAPETFLFADRVTYDGRRIVPMSGKILAAYDGYYEITRGTVYGYLQGKDGLRSIRKYKPPNTNADYYWAIGKFGAVRGSVQVSGVQLGPLNMHIDEWAVNLTALTTDAQSSIGWDFPPPGAQADIPVQSQALTALTEFSSDVVTGRGILRRLPGYFPANGPWGLVRKISKPNRNTRVEFVKRAKVPSGPNDSFDIPDYLVKYLRHYAMAKALGKKGVGQDPMLAAHFEQRYADCVERAKNRINSIYQSKLMRMGGSGSDTTYPGRPYGRLPRNLPTS